jgi:hypothetical protein
LSLTRVVATIPVLALATVMPLVFVTTDPADAGDARDDWGIPRLATRPLERSPQDLERAGTDGSHLYVERVREGVAWQLVRVDPSNGRVRAHHTYRSVPQGTPYGGGASLAYTPKGVVLLDGGRTSVKLLDPVTLRVRDRIRLPANTRSELPADRDLAETVWVGHKRYASDQLAEHYSRMAVTRLDLDRGRAAKPRPVPPCGTKGGVQADAETLVLGVECSYRIAVMDLPRRSTSLVPAFQTRPEVSIHFGQVWVRWSDLGYLARFDPQRHTFRTLDLNTEGPLLRSLFALTAGARSLWLVGIPADPTLPRVLYRIDPETVTVTARAWTDAPVVFVGDLGFTTVHPGGQGTPGRLARFDPASLRSGAPSTTVRPEPLRAREARPRSRVERSVLSAFKRVFDYRVPNKEAAPNLEHANELAPVRSKLTRVAREGFGAVELLVTDIAVAGDQASVAYIFLLNGSPAFVPFSGSLVRHGGRWLVTRDSICRLAEVAAVAQC